MRLTENEVNIIRNEIRKRVGDCRIYIFGSRVDDNVKGGDVDIYIDKNFDLKTELSIRRELKIILEEKLFLPVDIVFKRGNRLIEKEAKKGVLIEGQNLRNY